MACKLVKTLAILFCSTALFSHEFNPAHLVINELVENEYEVSWMYPIKNIGCLLYTSPSPRDLSTSRMPSSA